MGIVLEVQSYYDCPKCGGRYGDERRAASCCGDEDSYEEVEMWSCYYCSEQYDSELKAKQCHSAGKAEPEQVWECGRCESRYDIKKDAEMCCQYRSLTVFSCLTCDTRYKNEDEAAGCCITVVEIKQYLCACGEVHDSSFEVGMCKH